jgi:hypothetical protein
MRWAPNAQTPLSGTSKTAFRNIKDRFRASQRPLSSIPFTILYHQKVSRKKEPLNLLLIK